MSTALPKIPGWYIEFQAAVLRQLPRPDEIDKFTARCWTDYQATLKKELIYRNHYKTRAEAKKAIFEYIEVWYNRRRLHSSLGFKSPVQFEESLAA